MNLVHLYKFADLFYKIAKSRIEEAKEKYPGYLVEFVAQRDPSGNQKYLDWVLKNKQLYPFYDVGHLVQLIKQFHYYLPKIKNKDINIYKPDDLTDLFDIIQEKKKNKNYLKMLLKFMKIINFLYYCLKQKKRQLNMGKELNGVFLLKKIMRLKNILALA